MIKTFGPDAWGSIGDQPAVELIKASSSGLRGHDLREFIKRAGHHVAAAARDLERRPGEELVHQIAVCATEWHAPNRNGDGFKEAMCIQYHSTFEKHARCYREHANTNPALSYGVVRKSFYNPDMHRIELITGLNATKEAAARNGGLLADAELAALEKSGTYGVSMSIRVPHDVCSECGNKARNRDEYCTESTCAGGGLRRHIGTLLKSGRIIHADNPSGCFFDISMVAKPAERTAYVTGMLEKAASVWSAVSIPAPTRMEWAHVPVSARSRALAVRLADFERDGKFAALVPAFHSGLRCPIDSPPAGTYSSNQQALADLARVGVVLPPEEFTALMLGDREKSAGASKTLRQYLPGTYQQVLADGDLGGWLSGYAAMVPQESRPTAWALEKAADYSLYAADVEHRRRLAGLYGLTTTAVRSPVLWTKSAATGVAAAKAYAAYTIRALSLAPTGLQSSDLTCLSVLAQNQAL